MAERRRGATARVWTTGGRLRSLVLMCWTMLLLVSLIAVGSIQLQTGSIRLLTQVIGPARNANDALRQAMTDAQIGLTGYQLSGDRGLLQPYTGTYDRTMATLATLHDKLRLAAADGTDAILHGDLGRRQRFAAEQWWAAAHRVEKALSAGERADLSQSRALFSRFLSLNTELGRHLSSELDQARLSAQTLASRGVTLSLMAALLGLLAMLLLGGRGARTISTPLTELRDTVVRQREGELEVRAREDQGPVEIRSVAGHLNALTEQYLGLQEDQAHALGGHRITAKIGRAIRSASDAQQVLDVMCTALGEGLGVDRVIGSTFDSDHRVLLGAQWHRPELEPVLDLALLPSLGEMAEEMWLSNEFRTRDQVLEAEVQSQDRVREFSRVTGASASIIVPIGLDDRVMGMIYVLMVDTPREWEPSETDVVKVVAGFVARALVEAESLSHQAEYVERVERLDRLKSDFLATVSHELRTPLTSITGYLELLQEEDAGKLTEQQHGMLNVIGRSTSRLRGLIEDVMMLNRIEGGPTKNKFVEVSIRALITRVVEELRPLALSSGIELEIDAGPQRAIVLGDRASLERAVVNILSNAIKFSHRGGIVTITGLLDEETDRVLLICQDRGLGIPFHDRADLFTRFFRASNATDQSIPGTGLGLSIAKQIVEDHHDGELRLISVEGEGTTVVIDLPVHEPSPTLLPAGDAEPAQPANSPTRAAPADPSGNGAVAQDVFDIRA